MQQENSGTYEYHVPVLFKEVIEGLDIKPGGIYADVTFGGGGHSRGILDVLDGSGNLFGFDQDADAARNIPDAANFHFIQGNFRFFKNYMHYYGAESGDGILADLGVSSHHFDDAERGFSFRFDGALDMRMNQKAKKTAADVINTYEENALMRLFKEYGECKDAYKIAHTLVKEREKQPIETINQFLKIVNPFIGAAKQKKQQAQIFQALRIEVNNEMEVLKQFLQQSLSWLNPGGRLVVITYHSLEDRIVKNFFRSGNFEGVRDHNIYGMVDSPFIAVNRKVIVPSEEEIATNPRARSAKLRIAEKR